MSTFKNPIAIRNGRATRPLKKAVFVGVLMAFAQAASAADINVVSNGSFEEPVVPAEALGKPWTTYYGQNATSDYCSDVAMEEECNDGTLIPGWSVYWADELPALVPGRIEIQRDIEGEPAIGGITAYDGEQKAELDSHHRFQPEGEETVSNNTVIAQVLPVCGLSPYELSFAWKARTEVSGDNDLLVAVNDQVLLTAGDSKPGWTLESYKFISTDELEQVLAFTSTGTATTLGAFIDDVKVVGADSSDLANCSRAAVCGDKPALLELLYDADRNGQDVYDQDVDSVIINTYGELPVLAKIKVYDHKRRSTMLFSGTVRIGETFMLTGDATGRRWLPPKVMIEIFNMDGHKVQDIEFHTSCSQPLLVGDQFGGIGVFDFSR